MKIGDFEAQSICFRLSWVVLRPHKDYTYRNCVCLHTYTYVCIWRHKFYISFHARACVHVFRAFRYCLIALWVRLLLVLFKPYINQMDVIRWSHYAESFELRTSITLNVPALQPFTIRCPFQLQKKKREFSCWKTTKTYLEWEVLKASCWKRVKNSRYVRGLWFVRGFCEYVFYLYLIFSLHPSYKIYIYLFSCNAQREIPGPWKVGLRKVSLGFKYEVEVQ